MGATLRDQFLLDPTVHFLNHGSFGACPRVVFEEYQYWQRELERQPVAFYRRADGLLAEARAALGRYVNAAPASLVYVPNATTGLNVFMRSIQLEPGDEILGTNHEYGALNRTWDFICRKTGAVYVQHAIPLPVTTPQAVADAFLAAITPRTKVVYISHITSPTALILPVAEICRGARARGLITIVDGAHAPSQVPIDIEALDVDCYSGNCHKWLCAPKGAAFLYVHPRHHLGIEPMTVSHGWSPEASFLDRNQWQGTRDLASFLSVPAAIAFQAQHDWDSVRTRCHGLASEARRQITSAFGRTPYTPDSADWFSQMVTIPLPACDLGQLKTRLYDDYRIEAPVIGWNGDHAIRLSFQAYNDERDLAAVVAALTALVGSGGPLAL